MWLELDPLSPITSERRLMKIVVIGGTALIGSKLVARLHLQGHCLALTGAGRFSADAALDSPRHEQAHAGQEVPT